MYADEKSDEAVGPRKRPNKGRQLPAEVVEGRASPEGEQPAAVVRTLSRDATSIRLAAVRRSACSFKTMRRRRLTRGKRSYAGAAGGVIPVRCNPHHQGIGEPPDDGPHSKQPARRNAW